MPEVSFRKLKQAEGVMAGLTKLRADIEKVFEAGKIPQDYMLGFTNGVIFAEHELNGKPGAAALYDCTKNQGATRFEDLLTDVIIAAEDTANDLKGEHREADIERLRKALGSFHKFVENG